MRCANRLYQHMIVMELEQRHLVDRLRGNNATMFQSKSVEIFQDSNAIMFLDRWQDRNVIMFLGNNAVVSHSRYVTMFQENNAQMFQDKLVRVFQDRWQDRSVRMFQDNPVKMSQDKNVSQFQHSNANRYLIEWKRKYAISFLAKCA